MKFLATGLMLILVLFVVSNRTLPGPAADTTTTLPGAQLEIDAAQFPTLQAAFDALPAEGGIIRLPPGTFEIDEPLVLSRTDVLVQGSGTATHILNTNTSGKPALIVRHPMGKEIPLDERLWRVMLSNFRITGNPASGHGIEAVYIEEIFLQGLSVSNHGGDGVLLDGCREDPRVIGCLMTYNKATGLHLIGCHDIVVSANQFEENLDALRCIDSYNLCMTGNNIDDHLRDGVVIENTYGSVLSGNMIEECKGRAVVLDRDCYGDTISANVIAHNGGGVDLIDAHGCAVSANTFTIMQSAALAIGPASNRITVSGNNFCDSFIGDARVKRKKGDLEAAGMVLSGTSDVAVSGNLFAGVRPKALQLSGAPSRRILFSNNLLTDVESDHEQLDESVVEGLLLP